MTGPPPHPPPHSPGTWAWVHTVTYPSLCKQTHPDPDGHTQPAALPLREGRSQGPGACREASGGRALTVELRLAHANDDDGHGQFGSLGYPNRVQRGGATEDRRTEEMRDRRTETHTEKDRKGEKGRDTDHGEKGGFQRGREGQEGNRGHRSASLRTPPPPLFFCPWASIKWTCLMWASSCACWGRSPSYRETTQEGEPCSLPTPRC